MVLALPPRPLRWLYLDLNSYFASVEQQLRPELRSRPVIVAAVDTDSTMAIAASIEAKRFGIRTGTPVWQARRMCRELVVVTARHNRYVEFHDAVIAEVWRHIPVSEVCSIDEVACRLLDNENGRPTIEALAVQIKSGIRRNVGECLTSSIGVAPNRLLAKLASDLVKPDGLTIIEAAELPDRLFNVPISAICGIGSRMTQRLARHGIVDIQGLCARPPRAAGRAWGGRNGDRLWYMLRGVDLDPVPTQTRSIGHSQILPPGQRHGEAARLTMRRLLMKAASRLRRKGYVSGRLWLHARYEENRMRWKASCPLADTQDSFALLAAADGLWRALESHARSTPHGLVLLQIGVTLEDLVAVADSQQSLLLGLDSADWQARARRGIGLSHALDRINERFGRNAVSLGPMIGGRTDHVGAKIAFGRIPELSEFHE